MSGWIAKCDRTPLHPAHPGAHPGNSFGAAWFLGNVRFQTGIGWGGCKVDGEAWWGLSSVESASGFGSPPRLGWHEEETDLARVG